MTPSEHIGFIGLGNMGGAIALRLIRAGYGLSVLDLDHKKMAPLLKEGALQVSSPGEMAKRSAIVFASLQSDAVEEIACGKDSLLTGGKSGLIFVDLSSTSPELAIKVSDKLRSRGIEMLDAPVSGADIGATNGNLTVFVGGNYEAYQRTLPVLQQVGRTVTYLGKNGNGQLGKRINQMMQAMSELAIYEGLQLAKQVNLPLRAFARAVSGGCAQTWRLDELVDGVFNQGKMKYKLNLRPGRTGTALKMAKELGMELPGAEAAHRVFSDCQWNVVIDFDEKDS